MNVKFFLFALTCFVLVFHGCTTEQQDDSLNAVPLVINIPPADFTIEVVSGLEFTELGWKCTNNFASANNGVAELLVIFDNPNITEDYKQYTRDFFTELFTLSNVYPSPVCGDREIWEVNCADYLSQFPTGRTCSHDCWDQNIPPRDPERLNESDLSICFPSF